MVIFWSHRSSLTNVYRMECGTGKLVWLWCSLLTRWLKDTALRTDSLVEPGSVVKKKISSLYF